MGSVTPLDMPYTSAPILDYDEDGPQVDEKVDELYEGPGVATLAPEAFDAAILAALVTP